MSVVTNWNVYPNFKASEFACRCGCGTNRVSLEFMNMLQQARTIARVPFIINSGSRCVAHNKNVSNGSTTGDHISDNNNICIGADIACTDPRTRFIMLSAFHQVGFDRLGLANRFIHVGIGRRRGGRMDDDVVWFY